MQNECFLYFVKYLMEIILTVIYDALYFIHVSHYIRTS